MDDATGWCTGCFRSIDEIVGWGAAPNSLKLAVLDVLPQREAVFFNSN